MAQDHFQLFHYEYFEYASLLVAVICYKGLVRYSLQAFVPLLFVVCLIETLGDNYYLLRLKGSYPVFNFYFLFVQSFYFLLYRNMLLPTKNERVIFDTVSILCMLFVVLNLLFIQGPGNFNSYSASLTQVLNVIFCGLILVRLVTVETRQTLLYGEPYFWIGAATLLFNLVAFVLLGLLPFVISLGLNIGKQSLHQAILPWASDILYSIYSFAFILCSIRKTN
jgi:hypothetical protein